MRLLVLGAMFGAAAMAVGQSVGDKPADGVTIYQLPQSTFRLDLNSAPLSNPALSPSMDAGSILHPPTGSFVLQPAQAPMPQAQKLYPDLKLQPVETAKTEPIPLQWPKAKVEQIPTQWPGMKVIAVQKNAAAGAFATSDKAKKK